MRFLQVQPISSTFVGLIFIIIDIIKHYTKQKTMLKNKLSPALCGQAEVYLPTPGPPFLCLIEHLYNLAQTLHIYILLQIYIGGMGFCSICEFILWKINKHTALTKTAPGVLKTNAQTFQQCLVAAEWISILEVIFLQHFLSNDMLSDSKSFQEHSCLKYWLSENENG